MKRPDWQLSRNGLFWVLLAFAAVIALHLDHLPAWITALVVACTHHATEETARAPLFEGLDGVNRRVSDHPDAQRYFDQGLMIEAKSEYQIIADWYVKNGDLDKAVEAHEKLVDLDPSNHVSALRLADLLLKKGVTPC